MAVTNIFVTTTSLRATWAVDAIQISPNPTDNLLNIKTEGIAERNLTILVRDLYGRVLFIQPWKVGSSSLDVSALVPGHYLLEFRSEEKFAVKHFVKL
ncbi:T9SS type A sorting domain-containing protein [bacterium]|nr:T9SS type A sorting domain-containing protein [bacterium]